MTFNQSIKTNLYSAMRRQRIRGLDRPLAPISRSRHYLMLNILKMV